MRFTVPLKEGDAINKDILYFVHKWKNRGNYHAPCGYLWYKFPLGEWKLKTDASVKARDEDVTVQTFDTADKKRAKQYISKKIE